MKKVFLLLCAFLMFENVSVASAIGGYDPGAINSQYMRDLRIHELETRAREKSAIVNTNRRIEKNQNVPVSAKIKSITFVNNKSIPSSELLRVVSYALNKTATSESIADLRKKIIRYYQSRGFYSAVVFPNTNNLAAGELIFEINEGGLNSITIE